MLSPQDEEFLKIVESTYEETKETGYRDHATIEKLLSLVAELKKQNNICETDNLVQSKRTHILTESLKSTEKERDGLREELEIRTCPGCGGNK